MLGKKIERRPDWIVNIQCEDRNGIHCDARVVTTPEGNGLLEVRRQCGVVPEIRRTFRNADERDQLLRVFVLNGPGAGEGDTRQV